MPELNLLVIFLAASSLLLVAVDSLRNKTGSQNPEEKSENSESASNVLLVLSPYLSLLYPDEFWKGLFLLASISLMTWTLQKYSYKMGWLKYYPEYVFLIPGSCLISTIIFFLFFHKGQFHTLSPEFFESGLDTNKFWGAIWPTLLYLFGIIFGFSRKSPEWISIGSLTIILLFNFLPFFTDYYWLCMVAGISIFAIIIQRLTPRLKLSVRGGFAFISAIGYLTAAFISIIIYALIF